MATADWNFARSITGTRLLVELGAGHALPARQSLRGTGIREKELADPAAVVSGEQELRVIRNLLAHLPDVPALGIAAGMRYHFTTFGMLGFAIVSSENLRRALDIALRYFNLTYAFSRFEVHDTKHEIRVVIDASNVPDDVKRFCIERDAAALAVIQRELVSTPRVLESVDLPFRRPSSAALYVAAFGVEPNFARPMALAVFNREKGLLPFPQANDLVRRFSEEQCVKLLERYQSRVGLAAIVRERLARNIGLDMESIAGELCMTSRTLRRQLADEGTSFVAIRDEVRIALAEECLAVLKLTVDETAYRLGYASASAFITAFRRIVGETPLAFGRKAAAKQRTSSMP